MRRWWPRRQPRQYGQFGSCYVFPPMDPEEAKRFMESPGPFDQGPEARSAPLPVTSGTRLADELWLIALQLDPVHAFDDLDRQG